MRYAVLSHLPLCDRERVVVSWEVGWSRAVSLSDDTHREGGVLFSGSSPLSLLTSRVGQAHSAERLERLARLARQNLKLHTDHQPCAGQFPKQHDGSILTPGMQNQLLPQTTGCCRSHTQSANTRQPQASTATTTRPNAARSCDTLDFQSTFHSVEPPELPPSRTRAGLISRRSSSLAHQKSISLSAPLRPCLSRSPRFAPDESAGSQSRTSSHKYLPRPRQVNPPIPYPVLILLPHLLLFLLQVASHLCFYNNGGS